MGLRKKKLAIAHNQLKQLNIGNIDLGKENVITKIFLYGIHIFIFFGVIAQKIGMSYKIESLHGNKNKKLIYTLGL